MRELLQELEATIRHEIPLSQAIGIRVAPYAEGRLNLQAPLRENINHKQTVFAGSLNAVATLAGWGMCWLILKKHGESGVIVIQDSSTQYRKPVIGDFIASCAEPDEEEAARVIEVLRKKGRARLELEVAIFTEAGQAVTFTGRYVVFRS